MLKVNTENTRKCPFSIPPNIYLIKSNNRNTQKKVQNMFKVNNKGTRMTSMTLFCVFIVNFTYFTTFYRVSTVQFELANVCGDISLVF